MATSIQVDVELLNELRKMKMTERESYAEVIRDLIEDRMRLNKETIKEIEKSRAEIKSGRYYSMAEVKKQIKTA